MYTNSVNELIDEINGKSEYSGKVKRTSDFMRQHLSNAIKRVPLTKLSQYAIEDKERKTPYNDAFQAIMDGTRKENLNKLKPKRFDILYQQSLDSDDENEDESDIGQFAQFFVPKDMQSEHLAI